MKPWFNVNLEPLTCIITHGKSSPESDPPLPHRHLHLTQVLLAGANWNHKCLHSVLTAFKDTTSSSK